MAYGVTVNGFIRKRLDEILDDLDQSMKSIFGENLNLDSDSPDGQVNGVMAESFANLWEIGQEAYNSFNPSAAVGAALSNLVQINGIIRQAATYSTGSVNVTGTNGTVIPAGSLISTDENIQFTTDSLITIAGGVGSSNITAINSGPADAAIDTITNIDTPITGWSTVTNPAEVTGGADAENDADLRARRALSTEIVAISILESILASVLAVTGVNEARITENITAITDADGLDPHSFQLMVDGGADADIAEAIFNKKPCGIGTNGTTSVNVRDSQGINHAIKFQRPAEIDIYVEVSIVVGASYLTDTDVKQAIVDYANGDLVTGRGFGLGDDVIYSEIWVPLNTESLGIDETKEILIGLAPSPSGEVTIPIDFDEKANFEVANITVTQVAP